MKTYKVFWRHTSETGMGHSYKLVKAESPQAASDSFKRDCNYTLHVTHTVEA